MSHALERSSPKGPGMKFVGRCTKCGKEGLGMGDALKDCPMDAVVSDESALIDILNEPLMATNAHPQDFSTPPQTWEAIARFLWGKLDDIDTAGDMFKPPIDGFFRYVTDKANTRWQVSSSDGYTVTFNVEEKD